MKKIDWKKVRAWLADHWKAILWAAIGVAVFFAGKRVVAAVKRAVLGRVDATMPFDVLDRTHVAVKVRGEWTAVPVPKGYTALDVRGVRVGESGVATVEVKHEHKNRRP